MGTQSPLVLLSTVRTQPSVPKVPALFPPLVVMSVRVSAAWARTGLTTVDTIGSIAATPYQTQPPAILPRASQLAVKIFWMPIKSMAINSMMSVNHGAIVKPLTVWHTVMLTSSTLPEPVHGVPPPALRWPIPSAPTTRPLHMAIRPLSHHGLPAHRGCPQCVTTVNGVIPRPRSARTSTELVPDKNDAFEQYH